ncbi:MAG: hypothetical protein ABIG30_03980 [Candidatus Aenigmatarchaeota archaeon]
MKITTTLAVLAVMIVAAVAMSNGNVISGTVTLNIDVVSAQNEFNADTISVKNTDSFDWNHVRVTVVDANDRAYNCPNMLILGSGSKATIQKDYCFNDANAPLRTPVAKVRIITDEGEAAFVY